MDIMYKIFQPEGSVIKRNVREIDPKNPVSAIGYTKCLFKLSKYTQIIEFLNASTFLTSSSVLALSLDPKNKLADKQISFLKRLTLTDENSSEHRINKYKREKMDVKYEQSYFLNSRSNENLVYNILSIDGGGIRGILPILWLNEIEYRTRRPISHLFNMITGTSTGASELLETYQDHTKKIFTMNKVKNSKAKYINEADSSAIHLFTRNDAREDELKNDTFVDDLMAATSILTFFSPYEMKHKGLFIDGGSYIPDPSKPFPYRDKHFWASNQFNISNDENEQVSFEDQIKLDDLERIPYLIEIGHQYLE
ncbi:9135_t:CDS:2 [Dentiscutata heterogama]|uniref:9135_t:CDS:1 n=1 Tax=Dentiscutata heterogama TaxID=1316150 RepID=A0ACA9KDV7_9GLOM|nr:9135_t:CDS:2 [Dentiscutata heterogama]